MEFLKNLSIRSKLFLISVIPSVGLIYLLQGAIVESLERKDTTLRVYEDCEEVERLSALIHEFQAERGLALLVSESKDQDGSKMVEQERLTNHAASEVKALYARHNKQSPIIQLLDSLLIFRENPASFPGKLIRIKSLMLREISKIASQSQNAEIKNRLEAHLSLLFAKDFFSRTKNMLLRALVSGRFTQAEFAEFAARKGQYEFSRQKFLMRASPDLIDFYTRTYSTKVINEAHLLLDSVFSSGNPVRSISSNDWWNRSRLVNEAWIDVEKYSFSLVREKAEAELVAINREVLISIIAGIAILFLIGMAVVLTIRQILFGISQLKGAAQNWRKARLTSRSTSVHTMKWLTLQNPLIKWSPLKSPMRKRRRGLEKEITRRRCSFEPIPTFWELRSRT